VLPRRYDGPVLVAHGGMGDVYRATDSVLSRVVAVKLLSDRYAQQDDARARFRREALAAARLSHAANVVTVFDVAEHRGRPLIVMEYIDGGTVHARLRSGVVSRDEALRWLEQAARALDHAHEYGVVHRDVKPANLLLDRDGNVHVSDFGIASVTGVDALTAPGTVLGTAGYLAPEQARGEPATPASDRYALAVVAFELLTGRRPFEGDTPTTEAFAHLNADVPSATALDPTLPASVDAAFERALAKDPESRPATAQALVADLRQALAGVRRAEVPAPPIIDPGEPTRRLVRRSPRPLGAVAAVVATGVLAVGFVAAALLVSGDDPGRSPVSREPQGASTTSESTTTEASAPEVDGAALNDEGFARLQAGDYAGALPLLRAAVVALNGTNVLTEAYASYNLAFARAATGRCDGVVGLLDRSERIQGKRKEIDELRRQWEARCATGGEGDQDESGSPGKGHGRGKDKKGNEG
jgi:eukaryotic-like serine/threonine-protein kinase